MAVKIFDKDRNEWVVFPGISGSNGKDAYQIAVENGYTGTRDEFNNALVELPDAVIGIEGKADKSELSKFALKTDIPFVPTKVSDLSDATDYATKQFVEHEIASTLTGGEEGYVKTSDLNAAIDGLKNEYDKIGSSSAVEERVNKTIDNKSAEFKSYADGVASQALIDAKAYADSIKIDPGTTDLSNYYTKQESDDNFISSSELEEALKPYLKFESDGELSEELSGYVTDEEFDSYKTETSESLLELKNGISEIHSILDAGLTPSEYAGAPGYFISNDYNTPLTAVLDKNLYEKDQFGVIVIPINDITPEVPSIGFNSNGVSVSLCQDDPILISNTTYYRIYMIMYIGGSFFVNGSTFKSVIANG